jgi:hypothetical protein
MCAGYINNDTYLIGTSSSRRITLISDDVLLKLVIRYMLREAPNRVPVLE